MAELTAAQREIRKGGIGGSEAAAALGLNKNITPLDLYRHKVYSDPLPYKADDMALWLGHQLEPVVAAAFTKHTGMELEPCSVNLVHPNYPWMRGYIDRKVAGKNEGVELKAWSEFSRALWGPDGSDDVPMSVLCQCMHYICTTGFDCWHIGLLLGTEFRYYTVYPTDEAVAMIVEGERRFWEHVENETPPPAMNLRDIGHLYRKAVPGRTRVATDAEASLHRQLHDAKANAKALETRINNLEFALKQSMGDTERLVAPEDDERVLVQWSNVSRRTANTEALKEHKLWDSFSEETLTRRLLTKEPL